MHIRSKKRLFYFSGLFVTTLLIGLFAYYTLSQEESDEQSKTSMASHLKSICGWMMLKQRPSSQATTDPLVKTT